MTAMRFAVIGQPVQRSLSPALFSWLFARMNIEATYVARDIAVDELAGVIDEMRRDLWRGLSVTAPHKLAVRSLIDAEDVAAARIGAVNTLTAHNGRVEGANTDVGGCAEAVRQAGARWEGARVLVLGAGGAARAAVYAALDGGAQSVVVANRTQARARALADIDQRCAAIALAPASLQPVLQEADILVQSTTIGMGAPDISPLPAGLELPARLTVHDMVYRPLETALLRQARAAGCLAVDGLSMLIHQALHQFRIWTGREPPGDAASGLHAHLRGMAT